jgi:hypothetical protein
MRRLAAIGILGLVVALLGVAQLVLPGIAAQRVRDQLSSSGRVLSVSVHAVPAIELLWHHADSIDVRLGRYRAAPGRLADLLHQASGISTLNVTASEVDTGLLTLHDATLHKNGDRLTGTAGVTEADLRSAIPVLKSVIPVASGNGQLTVRGTASLFGFATTVDATVRAQNGALVVVPQVPFGALATIRVFADPRVEVESVAATPTSDGFVASATARLH